MQRFLPFAVFFVVLGASRLIGAVSGDSLVNFSPLPALFFCGMAFYGWRGAILPAAVWLVTYPITNLMQGYSLGAQLWVPVLGFAAMLGLARWFQKSSQLRTLSGSLLAGLIFYVLTNTLSWAMDPGYAPKSLATLGQALWTGLPGLPPTYLFFRNAMVAQALFTVLFLLAHHSMSGLPARRLATAKS
ncbi:MAG: hypothetical protein PVJ98_10660 [Akkermansiaceae bacterium]|jgi:hypothetical protein